MYNRSPKDVKAIGPRKRSYELILWDDKREGTYELAKAFYLSAYLREWEH